MLNRIFIILSALSFFIAPQLAHGQAGLAAAGQRAVAQALADAKKAEAAETAKLEQEQAEAQDAARKEEMFQKLRERMSVRNAQLDVNNVDSPARRKKNLKDLSEFSGRIANFSSGSLDAGIKLGAMLREMLVKFSPSELAVFRVEIGALENEILKKSANSERFFKKEIKEFNDKVQGVAAGDTLETQQQNIEYLIGQANAEKDFLEKKLSALESRVSPSSDCNTVELMQTRKQEINELREAVEDLLKDNVLSPEESKRLAELEAEIAPKQIEADRKAEDVKGTKSLRDSETNEANKAQLTKIVEGLEADLTKLNAELAPLKTEADAIKAKRLPYEWLKRQLDRQVLALEACIRGNPSVNDSASQGLPRTAPGTPAPTPAPGSAPQPAPATGTGNGTIGS